MRVVIEGHGDTWWWGITWRGEEVSGSNVYTTRRGAVLAVKRFIRNVKTLSDNISFCSQKQ